jgi:light-regulated signal transduction histidine kinase (bacteriophytochrome)
MIRDANAAIEVGPLPTIEGDKVQMGQVMTNLLNNAIKFRGKDPPVIKVTAARSADRWTIAVSDNGIGIDPLYQVRIFEMFQRLNSRDKYEGTGIGLALVKKIIERHGGRVWVESEEGKGATFFFTLPSGANRPR